MVTGGDREVTGSCRDRQRVAGTDRELHRVRQRVTVADRDVVSGGDREVTGSCRNRQRVAGTRRELHRVRLYFVSSF